MTVGLLKAGVKGDPTNSTGKDVADTVNGLITGATPIDAITLAGLPQTAGAPAGFGDLARSLAGFKPIEEFNLSTLTLTTNVNADMVIPSPYIAIDDGVVHPCVVYDRSAKFGYKYIMAYTPLANGSDRYENPTCCASNDLITWVAVGPQPIVAAPPAPAYNADTHIQMSPDGSKLYIMYRRREGAGGINQLMLMESSDLISWSTPVAIKTGVVGTQDYASPSFWFDPAASKWVCISSNLDDVSFPLQRFTSATADIFSAWGAETTVVAPHPAAGKWWHCFFNRLDNGVILALNQDGGSGGGDLYWMVSLDNGFNFKTISRDNEKIPSNYRSCYFQTDTGHAVIRGKFNWFFNLAKLDDSGTLFKTKREFNRRATDVIDLEFYFADSFNRADGALGSPWAAYDANTFVISSNAATNTGTGNCIAYNNYVTDFFDGEVSVLVKTAGSSFFLRVREATSVNVVRAGWNSANGDLLVQEIVGGSITQTVTFKKKVYSGDVFAIRAIQDKLKVLVNGIEYFEYDIQYTGTSGRVAMQASGAVNTVIESFQCSELTS